MKRDQKRVEVLRNVRNVMNQVENLSHDDQLTVLAIVGDCISAEAIKGHQLEGIIQRAQQYREALVAIENVAIDSLNQVQGSCDKIQTTVDKTKTIHAECLNRSKEYNEMAQANWKASVEALNKFAARVKKISNSIPFVGLVRKWAFSSLIVLALLIAGGMGYTVYQVITVKRYINTVYWEVYDTHKDVKDIHDSIMKPSKRRTGK